MPKAHTGSCTFEQSKRGTHEVCSKLGCKERFPCAGNDCAHLDCIERRGTLPKCHKCSKIVSGVRGEDWAPILFHNKTRAAHYECKGETE
jgi:hypothetical protein